MNIGHSSHHQLSASQRFHAIQPQNDYQQHSTLDFHPELQKMALFVAQTWKDNHTASGPTALHHCVSYVSAEMAKAGAAVGGPAGLEILVGGGSAAACSACKQVLAIEDDTDPTPDLD